LETVAIRVPAHRAMRALLEASGVPLAAPSANISGGISPTRAGHVVASLGGRIPLVIDDGATEAGVESTIVATAGGLSILREGPVTREAITRLFSREGGSPGSQEFRSVTLDSRVRGSTVIAPGQLASHYAPSKPLRLNATETREAEWLIGFGSIAGDDTLSAAADLTEAAAYLFDALHRADASDRETLAIAPIPHHGIGAAINDRLRRAAHRP
jgi:L-threonylcarbamoyladenylate synthase